MKTAVLSVAQRYAQALFEVAIQEHCLNEVKRDLDSLEVALDAEPLLRRFLTSPTLTVQQKVELLRPALEGHFDPVTLRFIEVVLRHGRGGLLAEILTHFDERWMAHRGIVPVTVTVARPLPPRRLERLSGELADLLDAPVRLRVETDPALIGGVRIVCGDRLVDNTLRGRLQAALKTLRTQTVR